MSQNRIDQKTVLIVAVAVAALVILSVVAWNAAKNEPDDKPCREAASAAVMAGRSGPDAMRECLNLARIVREHGLE
jgi:hypothetical protein